MTSDTPAAGRESVGQRLKRLRRARGLSQRELAAPGVSYAYISRIEAGTRQPSVKALRKLAAKLEVSPDFLETGSALAAGEALEARLAGLELAVRLDASDDARSSLESVLADAVAAGDSFTSRRARLALAELAHQRGAYPAAIELLEAATTGEPFSPEENVDIYAQLGRAYAASGRPQLAVALFERCLEALEDNHPTVAARYATLLSYALSDVGEIARAEAVVQQALERARAAEDPYTRVRLYRSLSARANSEGRELYALANLRKAVALLHATDDSLHLARAHLLAARIALARDEDAAADAHLSRAAPLLGVAPSVQDGTELNILRSRVERLRHSPQAALEYARAAIELATGGSPADEGYASSSLADALALTGDTEAADSAYSRAVDLLGGQGRWRDAAQTCRTWGHMLRQAGQEQRAMDVLDRAAELGMKASPADGHSER
jgi:transcriptional regulator with XRE-family HTH domain